MRRILLTGVALCAMMAIAQADTYVVSMKGPAAGNPYWAAFEEGAKAKGKELHEVSREEFDDIAHSVGLKRHHPGAN